MLKKIMMGAIGFALSSSVFAGAPYFGANIGLATNNIDVQNSIATTNFTSRGLVGGVFAGYGAMLYKRFYLGGEAFFNNSTADSSTKTIAGTSITTAKLVTTYSYGISLLPGILIKTAALLYVRAGLIFTHFQLNPGSSSGFRNINATPTGGQLGLGLQYAWNNNVQLRAEYDYATYRSFNALGNKVSPVNNMLTVGIIYVLG